MQKHQITIVETVPGYSQPNSNTGKETRVEAGEYELLQLLTHFPDERTDYALIDLPGVEDDPWVCIRNKNQTWGVIKPDERFTPKPLDEQALAGAPDEGFVRVLESIPIYKVPSTKAEGKIGKVKVGEYPVLDVKMNYPDAKTDYIRLALEEVEANETWICSRWETTSYAVLVDEDDESDGFPDLSDDPMTIQESELTDLLPAFYDFTYVAKGARYPYPLPGTGVKVAPPAVNNCCTFVEALVVKAWMNAKEIKWSKKLHNDMMVISNSLFSPAEALIERDIAVGAINDNDPPAPWTVIQGWVGVNPPKNGHTFIVVAHHPATDKVLTLESSAWNDLNGVGYRKIGNLRDFNTPPDQWWKNPRVPTWATLKKRFKYRKQARLKVKDLSFAKMD